MKDQREILKEISILERLLDRIDFNKPMTEGQETEQNQEFEQLIAAIAALKWVLGLEESILNF